MSFEPPISNSLCIRQRQHKHIFQLFQCFQNEQVGQDHLQQTFLCYLESAIVSNMDRPRASCGLTFNSPPDLSTAAIVAQVSMFLTFVRRSCNSGIIS